MNFFSTKISQFTVYADLNIHVHVHAVLLMYVCGGRLATSTVSDVIRFQINETLTFLFRKRERKEGKGTAMHLQDFPSRWNVT